MANGEAGAANGPSQRRVEIGTALGMIGFGLVVIIGSLQAGIGWGAEGPQAGFFPFYVGITLIIACLGNLWRVRAVPVAKRFAQLHELRQVLFVVMPTTVYVGAIPFLGIYLTSVVLITGFMIWLGAYRLIYSLMLAVVSMLAIFFVFERWFLVPLPKGPIEEWLGL